MRLPEVFVLSDGTVLFRGSQRLSVFYALDVCTCRGVKPDGRLTGYRGRSGFHHDTGSRSFYKLFPGYFRGFPFRMSCRKYGLAAFSPAGPLSVFHTFRACLIRSPLPCSLRYRPVPLLHFPPSGFCTRAASVSVARPIHSCPWTLASLDFSGLFRGGRVSIPIITIGSEPLPSWVLTLQGVPLLQSCFTASSELPAFRFDGSQALSLCLSWLAVFSDSVA